MCNDGRRYHEATFCDLIINFAQWLRRCREKIFLFLSRMVFYLTEQNRCAIL